MMYYIVRIKSHFSFRNNLSEAPTLFIFFQYLFGIISLRIMKGEKGAQYFFFCFIVLVINKY